MRIRLANTLQTSNRMDVDGSLTNCLCVSAYYWHLAMRMPCRLRDVFSPRLHDRGSDPGNDLLESYLLCSFDPLIGRPLFSGQSNIKSSATPLREFSCVRMCDVTPVTPQSIWNQQGPNRQEEKEALK